MLQERADQVGIVASTMCAVHCMIGAVLVGATGVGRIFADERLEVAFVAMALSIAAVALTLGYRRHRSAVPAMVGAAGVLPLAGARLLETGESAEVVLSVAGAALLVGGHWLNLRRLRRHCACCAPSEPSTGDAWSSQHV